METSKVRHLKRWGFAGAALLMIALYCYGAFVNATVVNLDVSRVDQAAYLSYARNLYETNYNFVGGRNRMPLYPFLLSLFYNPNFTQTEFFTYGKYFNILLSVILITAIFGLLKRYLPWGMAIAAWLITAFTVFVFRAGYVQVELLFYFLLFCAILLIGEMLRNPSWQLGIVTGIALGIAHLGKASVLVVLALFTASFLLKQICAAWAIAQAPQPGKLERVRRTLLPKLGSLALVIVLFLGTISPYIITSQRFFGRYFYNVNSTFYIWYNTWEEAETGTRIHDDDKGWPEMPPEQIPSASRYFREHTTAQIKQRLIDGLDEIYVVASRSYGYFKYVAIYLAIALLISLLYFRTTWRLIRQNFFLLLFWVPFFVLHILLYAWYVPIASGNRFILSLFLPFVLVISATLTTYAAQHPFWEVAGFKIRWLTVVSALLIGVILFELPSILLDRLPTFFAAT